MRTRMLWVIVFLVFAAGAGGWYMYWRTEQRLTALQQQELTQQKAIDAITRGYTAAVFVSSSGMTVRYKVPRETTTAEGSAIVFDEYTAPITKYTDIQRLTDDGTYAAITLADIKPNENIVVIVGSNGIIARLYAITP